MAGWLKAMAYGAGGVAAVGLAALVGLQERLVYVPVLPGLARAYSITPARLQLAYEDVWLRAADGVRLHSWFIRHSPTCRGKPNSLLPNYIPASAWCRFLWFSFSPMAAALQVWCAWSLEGCRLADLLAPRLEDSILILNAYLTRCSGVASLCSLIGI
jgi:hypothetical protein